MNYLKVRAYTNNEQGLPVYAEPNAAGLDLIVSEDMTIPVGETKLVPTGLFMELPEGYEAQIRPRSGLAYKHGIQVLNSPGTIDSSYRGEVKIIIRNGGENDFVAAKGTKIAQMVVSAYNTVVWEAVESQADLSETQRGEGGFGHTGLKIGETEIK